jgi:hypothetical protein
MLLIYCLFSIERFEYGSWNVLRFLMIIVSLSLKYHQNEDFININQITLWNRTGHGNQDADFKRTWFNSNSAESKK